MKLFLSLALLAGVLILTCKAANSGEASTKTFAESHSNDNERNERGDDSDEGKSETKSNDDDEKCKHQPPEKCNPREFYDPCPDCSSQSCSEIGKVVHCPVIPVNTTDPRCKGACRCKKGYARDNNNDCVPVDYCNKCKGANEVYDDCPDDSPQTCETRNAYTRSKRLSKKKCEPACLCKRGFFRNKIGQCQSAEDCGKCPKNNEYFTCGSACDNRCDSKYGQDNCNIQNIVCNRMCYCEKDFARATNGTCIPKADCQYECPINEKYYECPSDFTGPKKCSEAGSPIPIPVPRRAGDPCPVKPGCLCNDGFLRNENGVCVPITECLPKCKENEVASYCVNGGCSKKKCTDLNKPKICINVKTCIVGCLCAPGFLRAKNGTCVPTELCDVPLPVCEPNEEFSKCGLDGCLKRYCSDLDLPPLCRDTFSCDPGCECKQGFLRASFDNDTCVAVEDCPRKCPDNEIFVDCPATACGPQNCSQVLEPYSCPLYPECPVEPGCICSYGFLRDSNGKCIPTNQCPEAQCNENEVLSSCSNGLCRPQVCADKGKLVLCPPMVPESCKPGCVCADSFLRNKNNDCIPEDQCEQSSSGNSSEVTPTTSAYTCDAEAAKQLLEQGNAQFTGKFLYEVVKNNPGKSVFMSAYSLMTPITELQLYSSDSTYKQLASALSVDKETIRCGFPALLDSVKASEGTVLDTPAKIYVYKQGQLSDSLEKDSKDIFRAEAESIDFTNADDASNNINKWVSNATRGKITELVEPDMFDATTRLVLVNAIYFKGLWKYEFDPSETKPRDFYVSSDKTIQVPTMTQKGSFNYGELSDPDIQVLEIPYKDESMTALFILPKQKDGLLTVIEKMQDPKVFQDIINSLSKRQVTMFIPKITQLETKIDLKEILKALGITDVFDSAKAQLSGMTNPDEQLYVSAAIQKTFCAIDEVGSEAGAANAIITRPMTPGPPPLNIIFDANRPYLYMIKYNNIILFTGSKEN